MKKGRVIVVGIGPGDEASMTLAARKAMESSDVIAGYTVYVDLVRDLWPDKEYLTTPMRQETARCELAYAMAQEGKTVSVICSGDAGVYGMAGLILQLSGSHPDIQVEVVPGVTAALSGGAVLGAPLSHDFCVISLSDHLTPWELISERLAAAAAADFAMAIYNPSSRLRPDYLKRACEILLRYRSPDTVCGIVENIGREGELARIMTLAQLKDTGVDMFTTVFIGNSQTVRMGDRMVTPRGYKDV